MGSPDKAKDALLRAYPSKKWAEKVKKMTDSQATAIYLRLRAQGKI